uniref:Transposase domain-containing protein n=1 Tax=Phlebotomus papatasi TaxID=29031 RepID=A0A1B0D3J7_PHLPP
MAGEEEYYGSTDLVDEDIFEGLPRDVQQQVLKKISKYDPDPSRRSAIPNSFTITGLDGVVYSIPTKNLAGDKTPSPKPIAVPKSRKKHPAPKLSPKRTRGYIKKNAKDSSGQTQIDFPSRKKIQWSPLHLLVEEKCSNDFTNKLLSILRAAGHSDLPKTRKTLVGTPKEKIVTRIVEPGEYFHFGIQKSLSSFSENSILVELESIDLNIGVDGIPLFGGSVQLWPILASFAGQMSISPFLVGIYSGPKHPKSVDKYFEQFVEEINHLYTQGGVYVTTRNILKPFKINLFICDSPAKAFVTNVKGHSAKAGCPKCEQTGHKMKAMVYSNQSGRLRTDFSFRQRVDSTHHHSQHPQGIERCPKIGMYLT